MPKQLTVSELIERLKTFPPEALVWHEGCDCYGRAGEVVEFTQIRRMQVPLSEEPMSVLIRRTDED